jgi:hypothetical protein
MKENGGDVLSSSGEDDGWWLHPIFDPSDKKRLKRTVNDIVRETETRLGYDHPGWPEGAVEIGHNGGGDAYVFLRDGPNFLPEVYFWDHETGELEKIADDFSELGFD